MLRKTQTVARIEINHSRQRVVIAAFLQRMFLFFELLVLSQSLFKMNSTVSNKHLQTIDSMQCTFLITHTSSHFKNVPLATPAPARSSGRGCSNHSCLSCAVLRLRIGSAEIVRNNYSPDIPAHIKNQYLQNENPTNKNKCDNCTVGSLGAQPFKNVNANSHRYGHHNLPKAPARQQLAPRSLQQP